MTEAMLTPPELKTPEAEKTPAKAKAKSLMPAAPLQPEPEKAAAYECEIATVGTTVKWLPPGKPDQCLAAIVRRVNADGTLSLTVFSHSPHPDVTRDAVYHVDDPRIEENRERASRYGRWDFTDETKLLRELKAKILK